MKNLFLSLFILLASTSIYAQKIIRGNGKMSSITRTTAPYEAVNFMGSFDYVLVAGNVGHITIEGEENLLQFIVTEVSNNKLTVKTQKKVNLQTSLNKTIKITVPLKSLDAVSLSGSGDVWNEDLIISKDLKVALNGSGDIKLRSESTKLLATVTGSGDVELQGKTDTLEVIVTGSGDYKGFDLEAENVNVSVNGSGDAKVNCTNSLKAQVSGSGNIKYKGNPKSEDVKVHGSGGINKVN